MMLTLCIILGFGLGGMVYGQDTSKSSGNVSLLQVLPAITFIIALVTGMLNLYIMNKLSSTKEEVLNIVRNEFKGELADIERRVATKEQVEFLRTEVKYMLKNIETKLNISSPDDRGIGTRRSSPNSGRGGQGKIS